MNNGVTVNTLNVSSYLDDLARLMHEVTVTDDQQVRLHIDTAADRVVQLILTARRRGTKVLLIGNGGSAATVSHLHNDLTKAVGVRALVFNDLPLLTALANDEGYASVFEEPISVWADRGDVLIALSSSGRSENIVRAAHSALMAGATLITLSGFETANPLRALGWVNFYVPSSHYGQVEQVHSVLTHYFSDAAASEVSTSAGSASRNGRKLLVA